MPSSRQPSLFLLVGYPPWIPVPLLQCCSAAVLQVRHARPEGQQLLPISFHGFSGYCTSCSPGPDAANAPVAQNLVSWAVGPSVKVRFHFFLSRAGSWSRSRT